jgi:hypothetical protein
MKRKKYPKCPHYSDGKHRIGIRYLSFQEVCLYRHDSPNDICKCGFSRKEWKESGK